MGLRERLDLKLKRPGHKRPLMEQRVGDDLHRESGTWSKIRRIIDREHNRYIERIENEQGEVTRDVDAPLDEHLHHGADTSGPKAHP